MERETRIRLFQNETRFHLETVFLAVYTMAEKYFISILLYNSRIQNPAVFFCLRKSICTHSSCAHTDNQSVSFKQKNMNYLILTETEFFGLINGNDETINLNAAYGCFVKAVVELLSDNDTDGVKIALAYAENELEYHNTQYLAGGVKNHTDLFVRKALSFVRKMQKQISTSRLQVPPLSTTIHSECEKRNKDTDNIPAIRWTGKASDLVELIYGVSEMGCINDGETSLKEIADYFYKMLGIQAKGCYNIYSDIKMRKNESRTYFLDRAAEKVNRRMQLDEERERMRR